MLLRGSVLLPLFIINIHCTERLSGTTGCLAFDSVFQAWFNTNMPNKEKETQSGRGAASNAASNEAILAAINKQGAELAKVSKQVDGLKKSMEERLDSIESSLSTLQKKYREAESRMGEMNEALSVADQRITTLEATCKDLQGANRNLAAKLNDLEGRSRRLNVRVIGVKEGAEKGQPTEFISKLIPELLGQDNFNKPVKVDRAHRSLRPKPKENERPRPFIAKIHNDKDVRDILRLSRQLAPLNYNGERVSIYPDYTSEVAAQRQSFNTVRKRLTEAGARCTLRFPAKLNVVYNESVNVFETPAAAERFAETLADRA